MTTCENRPEVELRDIEELIPYVVELNRRFIPVLGVYDSGPLQVYSSGKTLADCFKFRNKVGTDVLIEALKFYQSRMRWDVDELFKHGKICRVEKIIPLCQCK